MWDKLFSAVPLRTNGCEAMWDRAKKWDKISPPIGTGYFVVFQGVNYSVPLSHLPRGAGQWDKLMIYIPRVVEHIIPYNNTVSG
jgi:hypothetical protein